MARESKKRQTEMYLKRKSDIFNSRFEKMQNAEEEKRRKAKNLSDLKERLTLDIQQFGLWVEESQIDEGLSKLDTVKSKRQALKIQLDFRNKVLEAKCERSLFHLSTQGVNKPIDELKANLLKVIGWTEPEVSASEPKIDFSVPVSISRDDIDSQKKTYQNEARETSEKLSGKKVQEKIQKRKSQVKVKASTKASKKVKKNIVNSSSSKSPVISNPNDLIGKVVSFFCERDSREDWHKGVVIREEGKNKKPKFLLQFYQDDEDGNDFIVSTLYDDFLKGTLKPCDVTPEEFIDASIEVLYKDPDTGIENWWEAEVSDIDVDSLDPQNPKFFIYFPSSEGEDEEDEEQKYHLEPLLEWYLEGWVRFRDCCAI